MIFLFDDSIKIMIEMLDKNADCTLTFTGTNQVSTNEKIHVVFQIQFFRK